MNNFSTDDGGPKDNTTQGPDVSSLAESPEYQTATIIWKICPPCILSLGIFGNIATVLIMCGMKDKSSQNTILMALAVSDVTFVCTATIHEWLKYGFRVDILLLHTAVCKVLFWMVRVSATTSAWFVTCVTVQRTMAVLWPHRMRVMCTVQRTWVVIATLAFTACAVNSHMLVGIDISKENRCQTTPGMYRYFHVIIYSWVYSCMVSVFPSVCLFVCDIILSVTLFKAVSLSSISVSANSNVSTAHNTDSRRKMSYRTTVTVLAISCAFLVLTLPLCVYLIWSSYVYRVTKQYPRTVPTVYLIYAIICQLWYTNSAINFFLYCLTGTKFRREFMSWIRCGAQSPSAPSVHETASEASRGGRHKHHGNSPLSK